MVAVNIHTPYAALAETTENLVSSTNELILQRERLSRSPTAHREAETAKAHRG